MGVFNVDFEIQNVVACANLHQNIDLKAIKRTLVNVDYNPRRFPGLVFRLRSPRTSTLVFSTGKMVCVGAKSEKLAMRKVVRKLKEEGFVIKGKPDITIENVVSTANLRGEVDLEMAAADMDNLMYEPEQFPGLIYRMAEPKVVILLFASGKSVITGAKSEGAVRKATAAIKNILRDVVLVSPWEFQSEERGDIFFRYTRNQASWMREKGILNFVRGTYADETRPTHG